MRTSDMVGPSMTIGRESRPAPEDSRNAWLVHPLLPMTAQHTHSCCSSRMFFGVRGVRLARGLLFQSSLEWLHLALWHCFLLLMKLLANQQQRQAASSCGSKQQ
ncbi:unnamed protein product [Ectocarpus sp. 12 AP-2014]